MFSILVEITPGGTPDTIEGDNVSITEDYYLFWDDVLLSLCDQTSNLSIGYHLISTCAGACD